MINVSQFLHLRPGMTFRHIRRAIMLLICFGVGFSSVAIGQDIAVFAPRPARVVDGTNSSKARLYPDEMSVATIGEYSLIVSIGTEGVAVGGGLLVDFPKSWFTNPFPLIKPVQLDDPAGPHYMECKTYREGATLEKSIDHSNFDGSIERFRHVVKLVVRDHPLFEGDTVRVTFKNTTSPIVSGPDTVRVAVDAAGDGDFVLAQGAPYVVHPGPPASALLVAPSDAVVGEALALHVTLFDEHFNVAEGYDGEIPISGLPGEPVSVRLGSGRAMGMKLWTPKEPGYVFPEVASEIHASGGPVRVHATAPERRVFWGDLHAHSNDSKDAVGHNIWQYARDATRLDFFGSSEHGIDDGSGDSISPIEWQRNIENVKQFYDPGRFVTLLGYECSLPRGHHNVFYRGVEGMPWPEHRVRTVDRLWELLDGDDAITIPHHLGIMWGRGRIDVTGPELQPITTGGGVGGPKLDWEHAPNPVQRPLLEIYSAHGQSEYFNRDDALAYESVKFTGARSADGPHYAREAWAAGHPIGVIAASDDHQAHPGLPHFGLAAVFAPELTREAIFDALKARHAYGTTGARILLEFNVAGVEMGQEGAVSGDASGKVVVAAPSPIAYAEVLAYSRASESWAPLARWDEPGRLLETSFSLDATANRILYLRTELKDRVNGRVARAWSSPIWLSAAP
jgi:hypothetical protein